MSKKNSKLDKIIMGAVIGGAIGSVIGITLAPKPGKEARKYLAEKSKKAYRKSKKFIEDHQTEINQVKKTSGSIFKRLKDLIKKRPDEKNIEQLRNNIKEIPLEENSKFQIPNSK